MIYEDFLVLTDDYKCIPYDGSNADALYKYIGQSKDVVIPEGIKYLFSGVFSKGDIESIVLPDSLTVISDSVFYECQNLRKVVFGKNTVKIGYHAFYRCKSLASITFLEGLKEIDIKSMIQVQNLENQAENLILTLRLPAGNEGNLNISVVTDAFKNYADKPITLKSVCRTKIFSENYQDFF